MASHIAKLINEVKGEVDDAMGRVGMQPEVGAAIKDALDRVNNIGICDRCRLPKHERQACWLGGQAWRCAEQGKVQSEDGLVNAWSIFRKAKDYMKAED